MLELINITISNNIIEADYIPEKSKMQGHISIDIVTGDKSGDILEKYGKMYERHALAGLKEILDELEKDSTWQIPDMWRVVWY